MATEEGVSNMFQKHMSLVEKLEKTYGVNGLMDNAITSLGSDTHALGKVRETLGELFVALEEAHYEAIAPLQAARTEDKEASPPADMNRLQELAGLK